MEPFRERDAGQEAKPLHDRLAEWAGSVSADLAAARPVMPDGVEDRPAECWEALLAVADAAGGDWPERARAACRHFVLVNLSIGFTAARNEWTHRGNGSRHWRPFGVTITEVAVVEHGAYPLASTSGPARPGAPAPAPAPTAAAAGRAAPSMAVRSALWPVSSGPVPIGGFTVGNTNRQETRHGHTPVQPRPPARRPRPRRHPHRRRRGDGSHRPRPAAAAGRLERPRRPAAHRP